MQDGRVRLDVKELNEYLQAAKLVIQNKAITCSYNKRNYLSD